jgi:cellulose biosynthesis protein BcsQ
MFTLSVVATKGGVGKTTLCANIGGLLADMGYRVLLIDADIQPISLYTSPKITSFNRAGARDGVGSERI